MTYLEKLFASNKKRILNIYVTAGFPKLNDTIPIMEALEQSGANIIELGMPYSDPLADGTTIQQSSSLALQNGMSIEVLLQQLQGIRNKVSIPIVLMGYLNPIIQYGFERFCNAIKDCGVDALIIPDMPIHDYNTQYGALLKQLNIDLIFLITPQTNEERIKQIDALSSGFLYAVTSSSVTGSHQDFEQVGSYLEYLKTLQLKNPILAGFGVSDKKSFDTVCQYANGGIIGSAFIKALTNEDIDVKATTIKFVESIVG